MPDPETNDPSMNPREPRPQHEGLSTADLASRSGQPPTEPRSFDEGASAAMQQRGDGQEGRSTPLFDQREIQDLRADWDAIQTGFVDEPRKAVEDADQLVAATMKRLAEVFAEERENLERQWDSGDKVSTEDLRLALRRYRSFFDRLLAV
jgi:hypothetical protein